MSKTLEEELSKTEISNQLDKEFRVMIIKVLNELRRKINKPVESLTKNWKTGRRANRAENITEIKLA